MTTPSGVIALSNVSSELNIALPLSLKDSRVLNLAGQGGVPIALSALRNKGANLITSGVNGSASMDSRFSGGTASCSPSVTVSGGTSPYGFTWAFTSNPGGFTLTNPNNQACTVSKSYALNATGGATATLQCTITDSGGKSAIVSNVTATLDWAGNQ